MSLYRDECKFGDVSRAHLATLSPNLQRLMRECIRRVPKHLDFAITCGHRGKAEQDAAYASGTSTKRWPLSKHNSHPARAVDIRPASPFNSRDWGDKIRFARILGRIEGIAEEMGIGVRFGMDWDQDGQSNDETLLDLPHIEEA